MVSALLRVAGVTAGLAESNGNLPPGLWLTSHAGWLPRTGISSGTLRSVIEYGLPLRLHWHLLKVCSLHMNQTEVNFSSEHMYTNGNVRGNNCPSSAAANQVVTLTQWTDQRVVQRMQQLAQCWFPGLAVSNAKIYIYSSNKIYEQFYQTAHRNCYGLKLAKCRLQLKNKFYCPLLQFSARFCSL